MKAENLIKEKPELFDDYDGKERSPDQQKAHDAEFQEMLANAPDYIKEAIAARGKENQPA